MPALMSHRTDGKRQEEFEWNLDEAADESGDRCGP